MTASARVPAGQLRCGRLLDTPSGLIDLPTGLPARLEAEWLGGRDPRHWRPPTCWMHADAPTPMTQQPCVDAWLTQDWLGRWVARSVHVNVPRRERAGPAPRPLAPGLWGQPSLFIARAARYLDWLALAAEARREGVVAVWLDLVPSLLAEPAACPPLLVAVAAPFSTAPPPVLEGWLQRGGRLHGIVRVPASERAVDMRVASGPPTPPPPQASAVSRHLRALRRAWQALPLAPTLPASTRIPLSPGGRHVMTHLDLLDLATQLDDVRLDTEALQLACRTARVHLRASHVALVARRDDDVRVVASEGPEGDSPHAWRELCRPDGPGVLVSVEGWHRAASHPAEYGSVWVCGRWPSRDEGERAGELLPVFARLVASRVSWPEVPVGREKGLERTLVGDSRVMQDVRAQIALAARAPFPVLIRGESGCGKELAARAIHALSVRRHRRVAAINCAALPDELIESELFGHVRGAFTGASCDRAGLFDEADGGTLFLDEVGELGPRAQAKLLRVLQDGEVRRLGENQAHRVDVRLVAATNVSLEEAVRLGQFRADLFYRLDVVRVRMPALRERREDIAQLARHFWQDCTARVGSRARLEGRALDALTCYDWPGNVRQLQNTLAALVVRVPPRGRVTIDDLPPEIGQGSRTTYALPGGLEAARRQFEVSFVREVLTRAGGRSATAARDLGLTRQGLSKLVRRLGLDDEPPGASRLP